jgi:hypothetical protein
VPVPSLSPYVSSIFEMPQLQKLWTSDLRILSVLFVLSLIFGFNFWPKEKLINGHSTPKYDMNLSSIQETSNWSPANLFKRQTYQCGPGNPCSNGACCGSSGFCGYGPVYCETGCSSNCDAAAECGQFAKVANTTCPLNTCCSQFGFVRNC